MKAQDSVRAIMKKQNVGVNKLADKMSKSPRLISERLSQETISVTKLREMIAALDYKIVVIPRDEPIPEGGYEIK